MFEAHQSQNQMIWISGLEDHRTRRFEAQEAGPASRTESRGAASLSLRQLLGSLAEQWTLLAGRGSALRGRSRAGKADASTEYGSLQPCC